MAAAACPSAGLRSGTPGEKVIEKARRSSRTSSRWRRTTSSSSGGAFSVKGSPDRSMTIKAAALEAWTAHNLPDGMEPGLDETAVYDPPNFSWPAGAHAAVVEVDTETGDARLVRYVAIDDVGTVVNPLIVDGQVHGGITQGIAAALYEEGVYDERGQPAEHDDDDATSSPRRPSFRPSSSSAPRARARRTRSA